MCLAAEAQKKSSVLSAKYCGHFNGKQQQQHHESEC